MFYVIEPSQVVCDQVVVFTTWAFYDDNSFLVGKFREHLRRSRFAHFTGVDNAQLAADFPQTFLVNSAGAGTHLPCMNPTISTQHTGNWLCVRNSSIWEQFSRRYWTKLTLLLNKAVGLHTRRNLESIAVDSGKHVSPCNCGCKNPFYVPDECHFWAGEQNLSSKVFRTAFVVSSFPPIWVFLPLVLLVFVSPVRQRYPNPKTESKMAISTKGTNVEFASYGSPSRLSGITDTDGSFFRRVTKLPIFIIPLCLSELQLIFISEEDLGSLWDSHLRQEGGRLHVRFELQRTWQPQHW